MYPALVVVSVLVQVPITLIQLMENPTCWFWSLKMYMLQKFFYSASFTERKNRVIKQALTESWLAGGWKITANVFVYSSPFIYLCRQHMFLLVLIYILSEMKIKKWFLRVFGTFEVQIHHSDHHICFNFGEGYIIDVHSLTLHSISHLCKLIFFILSKFLGNHQNWCFYNGQNCFKN